MCLLSIERKTCQGAQSPLNIPFPNATRIGKSKKAKFTVLITSNGIGEITGVSLFPLSRYGVDSRLAEAAVTVDWVSRSNAIDVAGKTTYQYESKWSDNKELTATTTHLL